MLNKSTDPRVAEIKSMLIDAIHTNLQDPKQRTKASLLGTAVALLRMHGNIDDILSADEAGERLAALRASLPRLPDLPPMTETFGTDDETEE
jgi:hypothetical protein